jgi:hypothetical protein
MKPVFMYSPGRSGGSALVNALQSHPAIVACGKWPFEERTAGAVLTQAYQLALSGITAEFSAFKHGLELFSSARGERDAYTRCVEQPLREQAWRSVRAFYTEVAAQQKKAARYFVEKGPTPLLLAAADLTELSATIVLARDPRDAVVSAVSFFPDDNPHCAGPASTPKALRIASGSYGRSWLNLARRVKELRARRASVRVVRYEDLVHSPGPQIEGLLQYIDPALAQDAGPVLKAWQQPQGKKHITARNVSESVDRWKHELTPDQQRTIRGLLGEAIEVLGYA